LDLGFSSRFMNRRSVSSCALRASSFACRYRCRPATKAKLLGEHRPDLIVGEEVAVEVKRIERLAPVLTAHMLTYLRVAHSDWA
jgi:hypothetical protein